MPVAMRLPACLALCASLLACAGPDNRRPSSPVAGADRSTDMLLSGSGGDSEGRLQLPGLRYGGNVLLVTHVADAGASIRCHRDGDARYRWTRGGEVPGLEPLFDACRPRNAVLGGGDGASMR